MHLIASHTHKKANSGLCVRTAHVSLWGLSGGLPAGPGWAGEQNAGQLGALLSNHLFLE